MKWGRFTAFVVAVLVVLGLAAGTSFPLWKSVKLGLDLKGGFDLVYRIVDSKENPLTPQGIQAALQAVQVRVNGSGFGSPVIQLENGRDIRVELAGTFDQTQAEKLIGQTADLKIYGNIIVKQNGKPIKWTAALLPYLQGQKGIQILPDTSQPPLVTGNDLKSNARYATDPNTGQNVVDVTFKNAAKWASVTTKYDQKTIYTFLNGNMITYATVNGPIPNGDTQITLGSNATPQDCITLANELNAGALPYPLHLVSQTSVGPTLGAASLRATMIAGLIAMILIFLFMIVLYRLAGLIADIAIIAYGYLLLLGFAGLGIVLTLPGLAALVLGVGMAVDANIINYERIKDEFRDGRSLQSGVIAGNRKSMRTILDSNVTTFIAGAVMYWFGQGDIRGFAVALMVSIIVHLLTAVLYSRLLLMWFTRSNIIKRPWWYGASKGAASR